MQRDKGILLALAVIIGCRCTLSSFLEQCPTPSTTSEQIIQYMFLLIIATFFMIYKLAGSFKSYIHTIFVPFLLIAIAKKHYDSEEDTFHLGECFCTFLIIMVFSSLNCPLQFSTVQSINLLCIGAFYMTMGVRFGFGQISFEFYHNMAMSIVLIAYIHK